MKLSLHHLGLLGIVAASATSHADILFNNLGAGDSFSSSGRLIEGPDVHNIGNVDQANRFTTGGLGSTLTSISLGIGVTGPTPLDGRGPVAIRIATDSASGPATVLGTATVNVTAYNDQVITGTFGATVALNANTNYWVIMDATSTFQGAWRFNSIGNAGVTAGRSGDPVGAWSVRNPDSDGSLAMRVEGRLQTVPEPCALAAVGIGALATLRRRKRL